MAVRAPFSRAAEGVRLPDGNPNLSATIALTQKYGLVANADGEIDITVLPNLYLHSMSTRGSAVGGVGLSLPSTAVTADTLVYPGVVAGKTGLGFDVATLSGQYTRYRIAAYGVRLRTTQGVSGTGEFTTAVMPLKGMAPMLEGVVATLTDGSGNPRNIGTAFGSSGPRSTMQNTLANLGLPYTGTDNAAKLDLPKLTNTPCHAVASASQVSARGLHVRGLPFEAQCRDYISTGFGSIGTDSVDYAGAIGTSGSATAAIAYQQYGVDMSYLRVAGTESIVLGGSGFAAGANVGTLEVIFHVEAMTNPQYALLVRPTGISANVGSGQTLDQVLSSLHRVPRISFADVVQTVGDSMLGEIEGRAGAAAGGAVSGLAGMLGRLLTAGA